MLEVLIRIPGQPLLSLQGKESPSQSANLALRGFTGAVQYYRTTMVPLGENFWSNFSTESSHSTENITREAYQEIVSAALEEIQQFMLSKVVLSRRLFWECPRANPELTFEKLLENYPSCTVFALKHPQHGAWMGASPEVLIESSEHGYRSMSLAGTRLEGSLHWGEKEIEEQSFVTKQVYKSLKAFGGKISRDQRRTFNAGPVDHLLTWVNTDNATLNPKAAAEELHPTPAICGTPLDKAQQLIQKLEGYDRGLYAGYLGIFQDRVHAAVLLRTMQWFSNGVQFYAGGGITKDSVPLDEWMETEHKISALKELIQQNDHG